MTFTSPGTPPPERPPTPGWGQSLSTGAAGLALLHIGYAHTGLGEWATAHQWAKAMTSEPVAAHADACLYRGAPAVAFVLRTAGLRAYTGVLRELDSHIAQITRARLERAYQRVDRGALPHLREFDLINGLTGFGVCLLQAAHADPLHPSGDLLRDVLAYLVRLTGTITVDGTTLPGWWTANGPADLPDPQWAGGHANLGLAHGIAGPLALLAAAMINGITVPGQADAIDRTDGFLGAWRCGPGINPWWPGMISPREWANAAVDQPGPQRPSWCYGSPGVIRARHLAAQALDIRLHRHQAEAEFTGCITDDAQLDQLSDESLCHGWAGLVHTARRMAADADAGGQLVEVLPRLERCWRHHRTRATPESSDSHGMLEGSAGVALTDLTLPSGIGWDACLLTIAPAAGPTSAPVSASTHTEGTG